VSAAAVTIPTQDVCRLVEDVMSLGSAVRIRVTGRSMEPFLASGDVLTIEPLGTARIRVGDVVLFRRAGSAAHAVHRVVRVFGGIQTRGDAFRLADEPVPDSEVLGRVRLVEKPDGRRRDLASPRWRWAAVWIAQAGNLRAWILSVGSRVKRRLVTRR
jgi:signal peptidase I